MDKPTAYMRRYGIWSGNIRGAPYKHDRCCVEALLQGHYVSAQCVRPNGHGPDGLYCFQHAKGVDAHGKKEQG